VQTTQKNQLYYGDNLGVLREHIKDESVDLIYLDPPFNSRQDYNVLFAEKDGTRSSSQIMAFEDTWEWNMDAEAAYQEIVERGGRVSDAMRAFRTFLGHSDMMAFGLTDSGRAWLQPCRFGDKMARASAPRGNVLLNPITPRSGELHKTEVPKNLKLLTYLWADVPVEWVRFA